MTSYLGWQGDKPINSIDLPENWVKNCSGLPEYGMGYQKVEVLVIKGDEQVSVNGIVLNCSILETVDEIQPENILDISIA